MTGRPAAVCGVTLRAVPHTLPLRAVLHTLPLRAALLLAATAPGLAAGLAGCGPAASGPLATNPLPSVSTSPPPSGHPFGESVAAGTGFVVATAFGYTQPGAPGAAPPQAGNVWAAADVQACAQPGTVFKVTVSDAPWSLRFPDGTAVSPTTADDPHFPQPRYPGTPSALQPGECLRGWVVFEVPADGRPQVLRYGPQGGTPIDWLVP
jgi:hypothetical protein